LKAVQKNWEAIIDIKNPSEEVIRAMAKSFKRFLMGK
jgi:hypothetical protein